MALTTRQNTIYKAEDWKVLYQSFINADFESYDFETLRKSMIDYLKQYYPEDFNDFIESSEFVALIDLIAYMGQNISYRVDLNSRENFLSTAERRESILRLARLVSYNAKRTTNSSGYLKLQSITTSEDVYDSNGENLANKVISWNDINNIDYTEQFNLLLNAAMVSTQKIGTPNMSSTINDIKTEQYQLNIPAGTLPIYPFDSSVDSITMNFEVVNATFKGKPYVYEDAPSNVSPFSMLYKNDGKGNGSSNTGFFVYFKEGSLQSADFTIDDALPNRQVLVNTSNITNDDTWLYELDDNNDLSVLWTQVPASSGNNIIYNSLARDTRTLYSVNSRENDQISYVFGDGIFSDIPRGNYRGYFRKGNGLNYTIKTDDLQNVTLIIAYINRNNIRHSLTMTLSLETLISNSAQRETLDDIRIKAPQSYYTQNRMVTGEDYNIFPITTTNDIIKAKATNRTSSGISRYLDVVDPTAKYSSTNVFGTDGILFREFFSNVFDFEFANEMDILRVIRDKIEPVLRNVASKHYYFDKYDRITTSVTTWEQSTTSTNSSTGYFKNSLGASVPIGAAAPSSDNRKYLTANALVKFNAPSGKYFKSDGSLHTGSVGDPGTFANIWAMIKSITGDGHNSGAGNLATGLGPVTISELIGDGAEVAEIIPQFVTDLPSSMETAMLTKIFNHEEFGLRFDATTRAWILILAADMDITSDFSFAYAGDTTGLRKDSSWLIKLKSNGTTYTTTYRGLKYSIESDMETRFYFDDSVKIYNSRTAKTITDQVNILGINARPDSSTAMDRDHIWQIYGLDTEFSGATNSRRVLVTFLDSDADGIPDNPDQFTLVVAPSVNPNNKLVFLEKFTTSSGADQFQLTAKTVNVTYATATALAAASTTLFTDKEVIYLTTDKAFRVFNKTDSTFLVSTDYKEYTGRKTLKFNYKHNSPSDRRINPGLSNIIDMYVLTRAYSNAYTTYIQDNTGVIISPVTSTTSELSTQFNNLLDYKMLSDEIIFHPVKYKSLFGSKSDATLQASFKIVKNSATTITDTEIKTQTIKAINDYFNINNWDFGDTFYFTELSAYIHNQLTPYIATILIVPKGTNQNFGSLFEIQSNSNEIFISDAKVEDIEIIDAVTASKIRASGTIVTS
jgi:hypothetical protein